jgi:hypothetical protein
MGQKRTNVGKEEGGPGRGGPGNVADGALGEQEEVAGAIGRGVDVALFHRFAQVAVLCVERVSKRC